LNIIKIYLLLIITQKLVSIPPNHQSKVQFCTIYFFNDIHFCIYFIRYAKLIPVIEERIPVKINFGDEKHARLDGFVIY